MRFVPPLALMGLIFYLSAQPDLSTGLGTIDLVLRKIAHAGIFGLLCFLWWRALGGRLGPAIAITVLYAISDEWHQTFVEGRHGSAVDVLIDSAGALAAAYAIKRWRKRLPARLQPPRARQAKPAPESR
ncbi:MAG: VanZ family protein [Thermoleophilaceae bacterium]|nr:VanZ family protein [Thermoleophilaceae bacterium]